MLNAVLLGKDSLDTAEEVDDGLVGCSVVASGKSDFAVSEKQVNTTRIGNECASSRLLPSHELQACLRLDFLMLLYLCGLIIGLANVCPHTKNISAKEAACVSGQAVTLSVLVPARAAVRGHI